MIKLNDIHKAYDRETSGVVLEGLNAHRKKCEFVASLGQSESGEVTLLHLIGTLGM